MSTGGVREIVEASPSLMLLKPPSGAPPPPALCPLPQPPPLLRADQRTESPVYQVPQGVQDGDDVQGLPCASVTYQLGDPGKI